MSSIVLASSSPRRRELLNKYNIEPIVVESFVNEKINDFETTEQIAMALAFEKGNQVVKQFNNGEIIIAADTIVSCDGKVLGKPKDEKEGRNMLKILSGRSHEVITGICINKANSNNKIIDYEKTTVFFRKLTKEKIESYINTGEYKDKAGGYGIQGLGGVLIEGIKGCYYNVVGLPLYKIDILLESYFDIKLL